MGRPPRRSGERLAKNRTFRVRGELDAKLQAAADLNGRSVSEEIEYRLDRSFQDEEILTRISSQLAEMEKKQEGMTKLMMEKQEEQYERLYEKFVTQYAEDQRADYEADLRDDPDYYDEGK